MKMVVYSLHEEVVTPEKTYWELQEKGEAEFLQFGTDFEESESGLGSYSTAIIKLSDGSVKNLPVENIRFIEVIDEDI